MEKHKEFVRSYIEEVFNKGDAMAADRFLAPNFTNHNPFSKTQPSGPEGQKETSRMFQKAFSDFHISVEDLIAEGDKVIVRGTLSGKHKGGFLGVAPTQKRVSWQAFAEYRLSDGKIVERWGTHDLMGVLKELGVAPEEMVPAGVR